MLPFLPIPYETKIIDKSYFNCFNKLPSFCVKLFVYALKVLRNLLIISKSYNLSDLPMTKVLGTCCMSRLRVKAATA